MSSGERSVVYNTDEQILSDDLKRQQRIRGADVAQVWRHLVNAPDTFSEELGSWHTFDTFPDDIEIGVLDPGRGLRGDVFEGLLVLPQAGTPSLFITPGVVGLHDPDGQAGSSNPLEPNPDDCPYKIVHENQGVTKLDELKIVQNAGPGIRIDIVECQRLELVEEQGSRNIYDPSSATGFTPMTVDKVKASRLSFRIRQGTPGSGMPQLAQGWLPLAVISIPNGASITDQMTFWDVRPVVRDRILRPYRGGSGQYSKLRTSMIYADILTNPAQTRINGVVSGETLQGYTAGGRLFKGTPTATMGNGDVAYIDARNTENQEPGFLPLADRQIYYLWACFPRLLPRWVRYTETISAPRVPNGPKGICVVSKTAPISSFHNLPATAITMPLSTGLAISATEAVCLGTLQADTLLTPTHGLTVNGQVYLYAPLSPVVPTIITANADTYTLIEGTHFPANARSVRVKIGITFGTSIPKNEVSYQFNVTVLNGTTSVAEIFGDILQTTSNQMGNIAFTRTVDIPRIPPMSGNPGPNLVFRITWNPSGNNSKSGEYAIVSGWNLAG